AKCARNGFDSRDRGGMTAMNRFTPVDVITVRSAVELFITIEFKMIMRIDEAGEGEGSIEYELGFHTLDHDVANARTAENLDVAQNHEVFKNCIPNTRGSPLFCS